MATDNFGFQSLDDILLPGDTIASTANRARDAYAVFNDDIGAEIAEAKRISANTADKAYRKLTSHANVTSYSLGCQLHECPRKFELNKLQANAEVLVVETSVNLDFAYGHAVGAGIQTYAATGSLVAAQFAAFLAWRAPWEAEKFDKRGASSGKSLAYACYAVEKFAEFWERELADEWEVLRIDGKPATELAFAINFEQSPTPFYHFGHIDTILQHKTRKTLAVWEGKTTGWGEVNEATYANSNQALGYGVVVDRIAELVGADGAEYEVLYIIYSSKNREFQLLPFGKTRTQRAEWLQDTLLDHSAITTYQRIGFYPKRGENCVNQWGRTCEWFGSCNMSNESLFPGVVPPALELVESVESLDYQFNLSDLIATQKGK